MNKTVRYQYDDGGNIQSKTVYALTLGNLDTDLDVLTPESTINYGYEDSNWKDKLTSYNSQNITYDGNEVTKTTDFITDGIQILSQKTIKVVTDIDTGNRVGDPISDTIIWQIDGESTVLGFIHNNEVYYYLKNAQGDIVGIADKDSNIVANYTYDSWGKLISIIDPSQDNLDITSDINHIGYINPLRYRGYYYDSETGFYYLNTRYSINNFFIYRYNMIKN